MSIGPSWCDIAGFLGESKYSFERIHTEYINSEVSSHLEPIEKLFLVYTIIVLWFTEFSKEEFDNSHDIYLRPAIELLEEMATELNENRLKDATPTQLYLT
ncbi:hypothetical protein [Virgibacillus sp. L01]|uniref:hypothetical protein n=1 Tax=Virgibacillus sp. L01 TaxID=3457429 RepID=UPI003FD5CDE2